jgi:DNA polymerase III subunit gamma/tau
MPWDLTYRPLRFVDVLGQKGAVEVLKARLQNGTAFDASYIFAGGSGQGKTTLARIFARAMLCEARQEDGEPCNACEACLAVLDGTSHAFVERDAASQGSVEDARAIVSELPFAVPGAPKRIYLFDECHRMSRDAQDALLKPLEEGRFVGMFCTTEPEKIRPAIRGRCEPYTIRKVTPEEVGQRLASILQMEGVHYDPEALQVVVDVSGGHVRDAIKRLEGVAQLGSVTLERTKDHLNVGLASTYYEILLQIASDVPSALASLDAVLDRVTAEEASQGLAEAAINSFRLAHQMAADFTYVDRNLARLVYERFEAGTASIAEFFLRSRQTSPIGLVCDLVSLAQGFGKGLPPPVPSDDPAPLPPVIPVRRVESVHSPTPLPETPRLPEAKPEPPPPPPPPPVRLAPGGRSDGVGNLGHDPYALTDHDAHVVPSDLPKRSKGPVAPLDFYDGPKTSGGKRILTPGEWRRVFDDFIRLGAAPRDAS